MEEGTEELGLKASFSVGWGKGARLKWMKARKGGVIQQSFAITLF